MFYSTYKYTMIFAPMNDDRSCFNDEVRAGCPKLVNTTLSFSLSKKVGSVVKVCY